MSTLVDARGQTCPRPLILTRQALKTAAAGSTLRVQVDNETSCLNVTRYLSDHGMPPTLTREGPVFTLDFVVGERLDARDDTTPAVATVAAPPAGRWVLSFSADVVGRGPAELGAVLVKAMLTALESVEPAPSHVVLSSSGVLLALEGSPVVGALQRLEARGVKVLACGTCLDWYGRRAELRAGTVSDMLTILEVMARAEKVLAP